MSIGLGIFLTALLLVAVWQIDKRKAWKKSLLWFVGVLVVIGGGLGAWAWWADGADDREAVKVAKQIQADELLEYWGLKLGMSQNEVLYLKGEPKKRVPSESSGDISWTYEPDVTYEIWFGKAGEVQVISCFKDAGQYGSCDGIAGLDTYDDEEDIVKRLGPPKEIRGPFRSGNKYMQYGDKVLVGFALQKQNIVVVTLGAGITVYRQTDIEEMKEKEKQWEVVPPAESPAAGG